MPKYPWLIYYRPIFRLTKLAFLRAKSMMFSQQQPILQSTERLRNIFKEVPVVAFCRSPKRRDLLVRAKLAKNHMYSTPGKPPAGTFRYNSRHGCLTCPYINHGKTSYTFTNTGETRQIKHQITCDSTNLTYMIQCKSCKKQYIGETNRTLRERFKELRQATSNPLHANAIAAVPSRLNQPGHSIAEAKPCHQTVWTEGMNIGLFLFLFLLHNHLPVYYST